MRAARKLNTHAMSRQKTDQRTMQANQMTLEAMQTTEKTTKGKTTKANDNVAIARAAYEAYVAKRRAAIEKLTAADFRFTSPLDNRIDRATYFARCWPHGERIDGFKFINLVPDRDRVFVTYEGHTKNGDCFRNTEIVTVRDGQIVEVEVYFGWSIPHHAKPGGFVEDRKD
jgi:ketosteroid isomerase-like protein